MFVRLYDTKDHLRHTVPVAAFAQDNTEGLIFLELAGVEVQNRAVWANIVKGRPTRSLTETETHFHQGPSETRITVIPGTRYHKIEANGHLFLMHTGLTTFKQEWLIGGTDQEPSPWFAVAYQRNLPLPILPHWTTTLWKAAIAANLVAPADTNAGPVTLWRVYHEYTERWTALLGRLVHNKMLTQEAIT